LTLQVELSTSQFGVSQGGQRRAMYQVGRRVYYEASGEGLEQHSEVSRLKVEKLRKCDFKGHRLKRKVKENKGRLRTFV